MANAVKTKSFSFALKIVKLHEYLNKEKKEYVLSKQLLRSGTAVGALVREAEQAESKADFVHKLCIALKEANETDYWLDLLYQSSYLDNTEHYSIKKEINELLRLLTAIINTCKNNTTYAKHKQAVKPPPNTG